MQIMDNKGLLQRVENRTTCAKYNDHAYMVMADRGGQFYNPYDPGGKESDLWTIDPITRQAKYEFMEVSGEVYEAYTSFLKNRKGVHLTFAQNLQDNTVVRERNARRVNG